MLRDKRIQLRIYSLSRVKLFIPMLQCQWLYRRGRIHRLSAENTWLEYKMFSLNLQR